jgi:phospholipase C
MVDRPSNPKRLKTSRRSVITGVAGVAGSAVISASLPLGFASATTAALPAPKDTGIDHIVVLMMENRSFDHMLGWVPGADGVQAGRYFADRKNVNQASFPLAPNFQNCRFADPNHHYEAGRKHYADGAMDGFLKTAKRGDVFPVGYYVAADVPFFAMAARRWTICDRYFTAVLGPTWPNRFYMHSGQTDRLVTGGPSAYTKTDISNLPTVWDGARAAGVSAAYYYGDKAFTAHWGDRYAALSFPFKKFLADAAAGTLPSIAYVDPTFHGHAQGLSNDDHPLADIRNGQVLMDTVYRALTQSPLWPRTLLVINYDEWGGFADHVAPPLAPISDDERHIVGNDGRLGFRVPCILIGPRARRGVVEKAQYDCSSVLNMITWRFGLTPLGARSESSGNIAPALDFGSPPDVSVPPPADLVHQVYGAACDSATMNLEERSSYADHFAALEIIDRLMRAHGFVA